jgi:hypothetical protein
MLKKIMTFFLPILVIPLLVFATFYSLDRVLGKHFSFTTYSKLITRKCREGEVHIIKVKPNENGIFHDYTSDCGEKKYFGSHRYGSIDRRKD